MRQQRRGNRVVAVGEDVGFDADMIADGALGRKAAAIDLGRDAFNDDALASIFLSHCHHSSFFPCFYA
jgi:hypothetical protein